MIFLNAIMALATGLVGMMVAFRLHKISNIQAKDVATLCGSAGLVLIIWPVKYMAKLYGMDLEWLMYPQTLAMVLFLVSMVRLYWHLMEV